MPFTLYFYGSFFQIMMIKEQGPKRITLRILWSVYYRVFSYFFVKKLCLYISKTKIYRKLAHKTVVKQHKEVRTERKWQLLLQHILKKPFGIQLLEQICSSRSDGVIVCAGLHLLPHKKDGVNMN